ncbi:hypothetical protein BN2475_270037 [Paraburkholderia ribeironis]|uniref:Uncharacterized protein n=1 Tax=Paraburkholderia ribeironis TaxID=1247936 RepID=A0A1N7S010_9BURK|nr:hypothetical protein BN2475_270037 [Paraburkholderia ribeironis]
MPRAKAQAVGGRATDARPAVMLGPSRSSRREREAGVCRSERATTSIKVCAATKTPRRRASTTSEAASVCTHASQTGAPSLFG